MILFTKLLIILQTFFISRAFCISQNENEKSKELNNRPIIGIMMQSTKGMGFKTMKPNYIAASYVKYLESSGARVVPIWNDLTEEQTEKLFHSINGVLFPGGDVDPVNSSYAQVGARILNLAKKAFDKKPRDYFPVWGICLGHEYLAAYVAGTKEILTHTNSMNITLTLNFTGDYKNSQIFKNISPDLKEFLSSVPSTANFHMWSVTVESFEKNKKLSDFFNILSTSVDRNGTEFVSTMEGKRYPFFATQWHPEKNSFEWNATRNMSHVAQAIETTQYMSNVFVNKARLSQHKFQLQKEEEAELIYNYSPLYTGTYTAFQQVYVFDHSSTSHHIRSSKPPGNRVRHRKKLFNYKFYN